MILKCNFLFEICLSDHFSWNIVTFIFWLDKSHCHDVCNCFEQKWIMFTLDYTFVSPHTQENGMFFCSKQWNYCDFNKTFSFFLLLQESWLWDLRLCFFGHGRQVRLYFSQRAHFGIKVCWMSQLLGSLSKLHKNRS